MTKTKIKVKRPAFLVTTLVFFILIGLLVANSWGFIGAETVAAWTSGLILLGIGAFLFVEMYAGGRLTGKAMKKNAGNIVEVIVAIAMILLGAASIGFTSYIPTVVTKYSSFLHLIGAVVMFVELFVE